MVGLAKACPNYMQSMSTQLNRHRKSCCPIVIIHKQPQKSHVNFMHAVVSFPSYSHLQIRMSCSRDYTDRASLHSYTYQIISEFKILVNCFVREIFVLLLYFISGRIPEYLILYTRLLCHLVSPL